MPDQESSSRWIRPTQPHLATALRRDGLSDLGIRQALSGSVVSAPADRAAIAGILAAFGSLPPQTTAEIYDYPGDYAQRFDGIDKGGDKGTTGSGNYENSFVCIPAALPHVTASLKSAGLSDLGIQLALSGNVVTSPADRAAIAGILAAFATLPPQTARSSGAHFGMMDGSVRMISSSIAKPSERGANIWDWQKTQELRSGR